MTTRLPPQVATMRPLPAGTACELALLEQIFGRPFDVWSDSAALARTAPAGVPAAVLSCLLADGAEGSGTILRDRSTNRDYVVIPIRRPEANSLAAAVGSVASDTRGDLERLAAAAALVLEQRRQYRQLSEERDALAERVGQDFEELHWLRGLGGLLTCESTLSLEGVARRVLRTLREVIAAEAIVLVPEPDSDEDRPHHFVPGGRDRAITIGTSPLSEKDCRDLVEQVRRLSPPGPVVYNRDAKLGPGLLSTTAGNVIAVSLNQAGLCHGWLIALNKIARNGAGGDLPTDLGAREFGSYEAGLMSTASAMLAAHARNVQLLRAEEDLRLGVIETMAGALDARDAYTCGHSRRVAQFASLIARRLGWSDDALERIYVTGLLHDVGKIGIPDDVLRKPGRLTDEEFDIIKQHPVIGHAILSPLKQLRYVLAGVLHHHERMDGRGYPQGLRGEQIPLEARVLAVADGFDAMTSVRSYRNAMPIEKATAILQENSGVQWDEPIVRAFLRELPEVRQIVSRAAQPPAELHTDPEAV